MLPIFAKYRKNQKDRSMIMRIQTLYLLAVVVIMGLLSLFPIAYFETTLNGLSFSLAGFSNPDMLSGLDVPPWWIPGIVALLAAAFSIISILMYKKRLMQIRINRYILMLNILLIASIFYIADRTAALEMVTKHAYSLGAYLSLAPPVLVYLATAGIRRDEKRVRAADRLR